MEAERILEVRDLRVSFASGRELVQAVRGVSFPVYEGQTLGVVGESGCGKSVTAHSILSLLPGNGRIDGGKILYRMKDGGHVELTGLNPDGKQMRRIRGSEIGMVFQDPMASLNPVYSIGSQIVEKLTANERMPRKKAEDRTVELLERLNFSRPRERMKEYPHQFSGGMKQRVIIAIAMITNPRILIADEPTTALDVTIQAQILDLMQEIQRERRNAIMLITHNMGILTRMADHVAVMYMGQVMEYGSIRQIFKETAHPYTQALLKCVPVLGSRHKRLYTIEGSAPDPRELVKGCPFAPRCQFASERCFAEPAGVTELGEGHWVQCHLAGGGLSDE